MVRQIRLCGIVVTWQLVLSAFPVGLAALATQARPTALEIARETQDAPSLGVVGRLHDQTGEPIQAATVELLSAEARVVREWTISNVNGAFRLIAPQAGWYYVRAWRLALDTLMHGPVELQEGRPLTLLLEGRPHPITLPAVSVEVESRVRLLWEHGFYDRQFTGAGVFLSPEDLSNRNFQDTGGLLGSVPGMVLFDNTSFKVNGSQSCPRGWVKVGDVCQNDGGSSSRQPTLLTRSGASTISGIPCSPAIYLDGALVQPSGEDPNGERRFDLWTVPPSQILALEVFRSAAEVPAQFSGGSSACGVVMLWTKARLPIPPRR
jgi:hypothetical protein